MLRAGFDAMQRRAPGEARRIFGELAAAAPDLKPPWLLIAQACRMDGDSLAEEDALDRLLADEPRNVRGLIMKGDRRAAAADDRAASSFYQLALGIAATRSDLPASLTPDLERADRWMIGQRARYEDHLRDRLDQGGVQPEAIGGRFRQAIEILTGRAAPFFQQPSAFYYPGLPQIQFFDRSAFPWLPAMEAATPAIKSELEAILTAGGDGFAPYVEAQPNRPRSSNALFGDPKWSALYLWRSGSQVEANARRTPRTIAAL